MISKADCRRGWTLPWSRRSFIGTWPATLGMFGTAAPSSTGLAAKEPRRKPYVFVTLAGPDDGGDFGPHTKGTKTSGIQEAVDYAHANSRDVYIFGGRGGMHSRQGITANVYTLDETLRIPWSQDFRLDGGNYLLAYRKATGPAIHIDSQMNCRYKFGLVTSRSPEPALLIKPETPGPDDFKVITASVFDFSAVVSADPKGTAILIDSSHGPIINSRLFAEEFNAAGIGVHLTDAGGSGSQIANNRIHIMYGNQYHARGHCTGLRLGDPGSWKIVHNHLEMSLHAPRGAHFDEQKGAFVTVDDFVPEKAIGADIFAQGNLLTLTCYGRRAPGEDIVFEQDAQENTIFAFNLPNGITNRATVATNRIIPNQPVGFRIPTPPVPRSGEFMINRNPYTVQILILDSGQVTEWTIADAPVRPSTVPKNLSIVDNLRVSATPSPIDGEFNSQIISGSLFAGQTIRLEPGEKIGFTYSKPPVWRWKAST